MIDRLPEDHANARVLGEKCSSIRGVSVTTPQTNIVRTKVSGLGVPAATVSELLANENVYAMAPQQDTLRWLTHRHVTAADVDAAVSALSKVADAVRK